MFRIALAALIALASFVACPADDKHEHKQQNSDKNAYFETLKSLVGTWLETDKDGKPTETVVSVIKLTGAGTAIHETLFPGQPHEMVTVYHRDGKNVVATHYCALGNQPRYKIDSQSTDKKLIFAFDGGTNFDAAKDMHMHEGTLTIVDANTIESNWVGYDKGKPDDGHKVTMKLVRKK